MLQSTYYYYLLLTKKNCFQDNIGHLYNVIKKMKRGKEAIAMAPEQTKTYMQVPKSWIEVFELKVELKFIMFSLLCDVEP